jgi:hypothetical protein
LRDVHNKNTTEDKKERKKMNEIIKEKRRIKSLKYTELYNIDTQIFRVKNNFIENELIDNVEKKNHYFKRNVRKRIVKGFYHRNTNVVYVKTHFVQIVWN